MSDPVLDSSVEVLEQRSNHSESSDNVQKILLEAHLNASYKETLDYLSGHNSRPKNFSNHKLKPVCSGDGFNLSRTQLSQNKSSLAS